MLTNQKIKKVAFLNDLTHKCMLKTKQKKQKQRESGYVQSVHKTRG